MSESMCTHLMMIGQIINSFKMCVFYHTEQKLHKAFCFTSISLLKQFEFFNNLYSRMLSKHLEFSFSLAEEMRISLDKELHSYLMHIT